MSIRYNFNLLYVIKLCYYLLKGLNNQEIFLKIILFRKL